MGLDDHGLRWAFPDCYTSLPSCIQTLLAWLDAAFMGLTLKSSILSTSIESGLSASIRLFVEESKTLVGFVLNDNLLPNAFRGFGLVS